MTLKQRAAALLLLLSTTSLLFLAVGFAGGAPPDNGNSNNNNKDHKTTNPIRSLLSRFTGPSSNKDGEWLTIDPAYLLSTLIEQGGLFLPEYLDQDLVVLRRALHCQSSRLHLWNRVAELHNFTIGLPRRAAPPLLRIGRARVHWDSYTSPVLDVEVEEVDVSVEFTNLLLTKNNWQQLTAVGFSPLFENPNANDKNNDKKQDSSAKTNAKDDTTKDQTILENDDDSWIRFGSMDVSGNVTLRISSKPLQRNLGLVSYDTKALRPLSAELKRQAQLRFLDTGRRGLTVADLTGVLQNFFLDAAQRYVLAHWTELAEAAASGKTPDAVRSQWEQWVTQASNAIVDYAVEATEKYAQDVVAYDETKDNNNEQGSGFHLGRWGARLQNWLATVNKTVDRLLE